MENPLNPIRWSGHLSVCASVSTPFLISLTNFMIFFSTFKEAFLSVLSVMGLQIGFILSNRIMTVVRCQKRASTCSFV